MGGWVGGWMDGWMDVADFLWKTLEILYIYMENCFWENRRSQELRLRPFARFARSHKIWEYGYTEYIKRAV